MIELRRWDNNEIIHSGNYASIKKLVEYCAANNISMCCADLTDAELAYANLTRANLNSANLTDANLNSANLTDANLTDADLAYADLRGVNLWGCVGNRRQIKNINIFSEYPIAYTKDRLQIGCNNSSFEEWWNFTDDDIEVMDIGALDFWKRNKSLIRQIVEAEPAEV